MSDRGVVVEARRRAGDLVALHGVALACVVVLGGLHVLDGGAVVAVLGMVLNNYRLAHAPPSAGRGASTPPDDPTGASAPGPERLSILADPPSPPSPPPVRTQRLGLFARMRSLSPVLAVVVAASVTSCASAQPGAIDGAPAAIVKARAWTRLACASLEAVGEWAARAVAVSGGSALDAVTSDAGVAADAATDDAATDAATDDAGVAATDDAAVDVGEVGE